MKSGLIGVVIGLLATSSLAFGCDCAEVSVKQAKDAAEIIFRGQITAFRDTGKGYRIIVFAVDRVWKGNVPRTFEMSEWIETAQCIGFWPTFVGVGKYLLVYAFRLDGRSSDYVTSICTRTALVETTKDFAVLGAGHAPK
jgi:hypothetical protein